MRYNDSTLIENLTKFSYAEDVDKFIKFPDLDVKPLSLVELIEEQFHWNGIVNAYLFKDSKTSEIDGEFDTSNCFNITAIDSNNDLYLFGDETDFYVYLEHDTYLAVLRAKRYEVSEEEMSQLIEKTRQGLIERSEQLIKSAKLKLKRLKGEQR